MQTQKEQSREQARMHQKKMAPDFLVFELQLSTGKGMLWAASRISAARQNTKRQESSKFRDAKGRAVLRFRVLGFRIKGV